jgi:hypothetical protein
MLAVEQGPNDAETGLVTEELEHPHGGLELTMRGNHVYLRIHADRLPRRRGRCRTDSAGAGWGPLAGASWWGRPAQDEAFRRKVPA